MVIRKQKEGLGGIEVTVIVASYNPIWEKLRRTLCSIILQKDIHIEIIVVDDGSEDNLFIKIRNFFYEYNFKEYILMDSDINQGTCINIYRGAKAAKGKYLKCISPGDYLYEETTLKQMYEYAEKNNADVCFGEAIYYSESIEGFKVWEVSHNPLNMSIYTNKNVDKNALKINYLICNDFALGASFFSEKNVTVKYLKKIIGRVKYAEDNIYRLMVFEGIVLHYVKKNIVWYEFGTGISTSQNRKWGRAIKKDIIATNRIMRKDMKIHNFFDFRYKFMLLAGGRIQKHLSCFFFPEGIKYFIYRKKFPVYTVTNFDLSFYKKLQVL